MSYLRGVDSLEVVWSVIEDRLEDAKLFANDIVDGGYFPNFEQAVANANLESAGLRNTLLDILAADVIALKG